MRTSHANRARPGILTFLIVLAFAALFQGTALAHGDLESTIPEADSKLKKPTDHIIINFTEPPAKASSVEVVDGCKDDIIEEVDFEERVAHVFLSEGQPGRWKVSYQVVSAADGHKTDGSYSLTVAGKADCSDKGGGKDDANGGDDDSDGTGSGPSAGGDDPDEEGSSFPVVPVIIGTAVLLALALLARRLSG